MPAAARRVRAEVSMRRKFVRITRLSWVCCVVAFELMAPAASSAGPGNFNGDARAELAVFRPSTGRCYVQGQADSVCGAPGDIPVPGDYNGDGRMGLGMYRPSTGVWSLGDAGITVTFGSGGAIPVPGDYNGDGRTDPAVFLTNDASGGAVWIVRGGLVATFGLRGDIPASADYDGDGRTD